MAEVRDNHNPDSDVCHCWTSVTSLGAILRQAKRNVRPPVYQLFQERTSHASFSRTEIVSFGVYVNTEPETLQP